MKWFESVRRVVIFILGCFCFIKGVISPENTVPELIIGMVMVGVLPIEELAVPWRRRRKDKDEL